MAKQSYSIKGTNIANGDAVGNQIEQTVSVDDNILPAPQELAEYQKIDPKIVDFLIKSSEREQQHRHKQDEKKLKILTIHSYIYIMYFNHLKMYKRLNIYSHIFLRKQDLLIQMNLNLMKINNLCLKELSILPLPFTIVEMQVRIG